MDSVARGEMAEAEHQEYGEALLGLIENATERRQEQDSALLDANHSPPHCLYRGRGVSYGTL